MQYYLNSTRLRQQFSSTDSSKSVKSFLYANLGFTATQIEQQDQVMIWRVSDGTPISFIGRASSLERDALLCCVKEYFARRQGTEV